MNVATHDLHGVLLTIIPLGVGNTGSHWFSEIWMSQMSPITPTGVKALLIRNHRVQNIIDPGSHHGQAKSFPVPAPALEGAYLTF